MDVDMIDTAPALQAFIAGLPEFTDGQPGLYVDLEGNNLSRHGTLSLVTILVEPRHTVHLIDVKTLGAAAFTTSDPNGKSIQEILESKDVVKVFFDIRNDSDALFSLFDVRVAGIEDVQLMEVASRTSSKRLLNGLAKCIERDAPISFADKHEWRTAKDEGHRLFDPARGGSFTVFNERPLTPAMKKYCVQDDLHMPALQSAYKAKIGKAWEAKIQEETTARIELSQSPNFNGKGRHMVEAPHSWRSGEDSQDGDASFEVARAIISANLRYGDRFIEDYEDEVHEYDHGISAWDDPMSQDEDDNFKDFTACDIECGYCGQCPY